MWMRLEKINPGRRQKRFYLLQVTQTLFGEWCVIREWGRIGNAGGQQRVEYHRSKAQAHAALAHQGRKTAPRIRANPGAAGDVLAQQ